MINYIFKCFTLRESLNMGIKALKRVAICFSAVDREIFQNNIPSPKIALKALPLGVGELHKGKIALAAGFWEVLLLLLSEWWLDQGAGMAKGFG